MREVAEDPRAEFRRVNVEGTRAVLSAARAAGVHHVVFMSSVKANGDNREAPYTESDASRPADPYGRSKLEAEEVVRTAGAGVAWTIVRPPLVYGPGVAGNFRRLLRLADTARRWPLPLGGIDNQRSMVFVDNLADAVSAILSHEAALGRTYLVSDGHDLSVSEVLRRLVIAMGGRARFYRAPIGAIRGFAALTGRDADVNRVLGTLRVDSSLIQSTLGWRPPVEVDHALATTAQWWRSTVGG